MNKIYLITSIMFLVSCLNKKTPEIIEIVNTPEIQLTSEIQSDISFGVRGNCGMCKSTIEAAAMSINGVDNASWSTESKIINININSDVNDELLSDIHNAISKSGYDTEISLAVAENYDKLPMCCKYDREMVIASND
jgi:copper chaperone CopZ